MGTVSAQTFLYLEGFYEKIAICVVLLFCLGTGSLFAQDVLSFPSPITPVHPIINAGVALVSGGFF
jgi:hypothetical protein